MGVEKIRKLIRNLERAKIMVVGDIMLDAYLRGKVGRISPEAPVPIVDVTGETYILGGAANVANNAQALGAQVFTLGVVGNDQASETVRTMFAEKKMKTEGLLVDPMRPTTIKTRVIAHNQQVVRIDRENRNMVAGETAAKIISFVQERIDTVGVVVLSDYAKGVLGEEVCRSIIKLAKSAGKVTIVDPKGNNYAKYLNTDIITPNLKEVQEATGVIVTDSASLIEAGKKLFAKVRFQRAAIVTRGEDGMSIFQADGQLIHVTATSASEVFDVTGAGDTVVATLAIALDSGFSLEEASVISNFAAGVVVRKVGTATASVKEVLQDIKYREATITHEAWLDI